MNKTKRKYLLIVFILAIIYLAVHFDIMLDPNSPFYKTMPNFDKVEHFVSGFILAAFTILLFPQKKWSQTALVTLTVITLLGLGFEILESFTIYGGNNMDTFTDLCSNALGACLALVLTKKTW